MKIDSRIDALYQLPLEQFTEKRNELAKELAGEPKKQVKFLAKPPLPIWGVNQLYWHDRPAYNALIDASEKLRTAHRAALNGQKVDVRKPELVHRAALEKAFVRTIGLIEQSQGRASDAARETVRTALAALPNDEAPGRLTRAPEAAGFSLLTGITPREIEPARPEKEPTAERPKAGAVSKGTQSPTAKERAAQKQAEQAARERAAELALAERQLKRAEKAAEQATFAVRSLMTDLQKAQNREDALSVEVAKARQKVENLR